MSEKRPGIDKVVEYLKGLKDPVVIDLGAHMGKTTQIWLDAGAGTVIAVEPGYTSYGYLCNRFVDNTNVSCLRAVAISERQRAECAIMSLYVPNDRGGKDKSQGSSVFRDPIKQKKRDGKISKYHDEMVATTSVVRLMSTFQMAAVSLLKVNIEGAEYEALKGFPDGIRAVFVSWHSHPPFDSEEYHQQYANICGEFDSKGMECVSCESRGDHTWEFWNENTDSPD